MAFDITTNETFEVETCCSCGVRFAMTKAFKARRLENRGPNSPFYCPNGHKQWYAGESEAEKFKRERDKLAEVIASRDRRITELRDDRDAEKRRGAAARGQVTKIRNRVGHGVCPCCNRTFQDLARHMGTQHPTFTAQAAE